MVSVKPVFYTFFWIGDPTVMDIDGQSLKRKNKGSVSRFFF
jgi:hypothetical protein